MTERGPDAFGVSHRHRFSKILSLATLVMAIPLSLVFGVLGELVTLTHNVQANTRQDLKHMEYGYPMHWLSQDDSLLTPPARQFPISYSFSQPQDNPINVRPGRFLGDVAILSTVPFAAFMVVAGGFALLARRPRHVPANATA